MKIISIKICFFKFRLQAFQVENENVKRDLLEYNKIDENKRVELHSLLDEKEKVIEKMKEEIQLKNCYILKISEKNKDLARNVEEFKRKDGLIKDLQDKNNEHFKELLLLQTEMELLSKEKCLLSGKNNVLKYDFINCQKNRAELKKEIDHVKEENKNLSSFIDILKYQFEKVICAEIESKIGLKIEYSNKMMKNTDLLENNYITPILQEEVRNLNNFKKISLSNYDNPGGT